MKTIVNLFFLLASVYANAQSVITVAGNGISGYTGDGGRAVAAEIRPAAICFDAAGNLYMSDQAHSCVRKVSTAGIITTVAGNGTVGYSGDGGAATAAELSGLIGITVDASGNLYIADGFNNCVRKVNTAGIITTVAGSYPGGYYGDTGPATAAGLMFPGDVAVDASGNLYIADINNFVIRKVNTSGIITTVAGDGTMGYSGDGGAATAADMMPNSVSVDAAGNLLIADNGAYGNIRKINTSGIITTIAGTTSAGFSGDGGPATAAKLNSPNQVIADAAGNIYIADANNYRIRKVNASGIITTIAGNGTATFSGDGGPATAAGLTGPWWLALDPSGNIYFTESGRVRELTGTPNVIWGSAVFTGASMPDSTCKVWLIEYDSTTTTLSAVDSTTTCIVSNACFFEFINEPGHDYLIKAAVIAAPDSGSGYVPTYHSSSFYWDTANYVSHAGGNDGPENITMQYGTLTGGPGFIAGNVMSGANRGTSGLAAVNNMLILLRNGSGGLVAYTHTDASGNYSFSNIANGTYNVYPEAMGYTTTPCPELNISALQETAYGIDFIQHKLSMTITPGSAGVKTYTESSSITVFPNPVHAQLTIQSAGFVTQNAASAQISSVDITDILGQMIHHEAGQPCNNMQVDVTDLPAGVYFVKINGTDVRKFVKE